MTALFLELPIRQPADVSVVRHVAGRMAAEQDFPGRRQAEIRLMASELAQNHLDHKTQNGLIRVSSLMIQDIPCLTLASIDQGPGIADVAALLALKNGYPSVTGLGAGLVSIRRLADHFAVCSGNTGPYRCHGPLTANPGTIIVARCWPDRPPPLVLSDPQLDIAALVSGRSEIMPCGDGLLVSGNDRFFRIVLVDSPGLGKGCALTRKIKARLRDMDMIWPPDQLFERLSFALAEGASLVILRFDRLLQELQWAGVGNISNWIAVDNTLVQTGPQQPQTPSGLNSVKLWKISVQQEVRGLMHSDGLQAFRQSEMKSLLTGPPTNESSIIVQSAFSMNRQQQDDAALCVWQWVKQQP